MALPRFKRNDDNLNKAGQNKGDTYIFNFKNGRTQLRVMPAYDEKGVWFHRVREHYLAEVQRSMVCTKDAAGRCPVCEFGQSLVDDNQEKRAEGFRARTAFLINAIILSEPLGKISPKNGIRAVRVGAKVHAALFDYDQDKAGGYGDIVDLDNGMNVNIDRAGLGLNTTYTVKVVPQRTDILKSLTEEGFDISQLQYKALDKLLVPKSYDDAVVEFETLMAGAPEEEPQPVEEVTPLPTPKLATEEVSAPAEAPKAAAFRVPSPKLSTTVAPPTLKIRKPE